MVRSSPCSLAADVVNNVSVLLALIRNVEDVWNWRRASSTNAPRTPSLRLPCRKSTVFLNPNLYLGVMRRSRTRDHQFRVAFRSEERRVGKECRSRWSTYSEKRKNK